MAKKKGISKIPNWSVGAAITALFVLVFLLRGSIGFLSELELKTYDMRMRLFTGPVASDRIAIVAIDAESIAKLGRWPWSRDKVAAMIDKLSAAGAKVIGLNILFTEPEESTGLKTVRTLKDDFSRLKIANSSDGKAFSSNLIAIEAELDNDKKLSNAIETAGNVVLPFVFTISSDIGAQEVEAPEFVVRSALNAIMPPEGETIYAPFPASDALYPLPAFGNAGSGIGHMNKFPGKFPDGIDRYEGLVVAYGGGLFPSYALAVANKYAGGSAGESVTVDLRPEGGGIKMAGADVPTDDNLGMLINYYDPSSQFPVYSFFDVYNDKVSLSVFKGKIVLIGITDIGLGDVSPTPVHPVYPSVQREATVIENILTGSAVFDPWWSPVMSLVLIVVFGIITTVLLSRFAAMTGAVVCFAFFVTYVAAVFYLFSARHLWLDVTYPPLLLVVNYLAIASKKFWFTEKAKEDLEVESDEANKLLGLTFQGKGMLEMAYEKFKRMVVDDEMKGILYNLGLDFEKKRMWGQALTVYERLKDKKYKDVGARVERLSGYTSGVGSPVVNLKGDDRTIMTQGGEKPVLGRYEIVKELGRGAMGVVYQGKDPKINRVVAIKTLNLDDIEEKLMPQIKERFFREAQSAGALNHPNILTIFDTGEDANVAYIAMEFIDGKTLESWAKKENLLPIKDALLVVAKIADALDYAHSHGIVHRDIKPANIMVTKKGEIKVADFGIARVQSSSQTKTGTVMGTPSYMSPEQVAGKKVDGKSDIFSLGVLLYEMLTSERPFKGDSIAALMYNITNSPGDPLSEHNKDLPDFCQKLIDKALEKDPDKRFQTAGEFAGAIRWCLSKWK
ncbi:MAG: serine/threonine-protein kinase [Thermodesulfobacteriota bacterium]